MPTGPALPEAPRGPGAHGGSGGRGRALALVLWCLFIVYGSFIPFRFSLTPGALQRGLARAEVLAPRDGRDVSTPDLVSNVLLFVPLGLLAAARPGGLPRAVLTAGALGAGLATAVEAGQLFAPGRTASLLDVAANTLGALAGAGLARMLAGAGPRPDPGRLAAVIRGRPALVPVALLAAAWIVDSFYPFALTLDVSTPWTNLRHARWIPFRADARGFWLDPVVDRAVLGALLAALLRQLTRLRHPGSAAARAWLLTSSFAVALEVGKLFFVGRRADVDGVLLAAAGAGLGVTLVPRLARWWSARWRPAWLVLLLAAALVAYAELTPFRLATSHAALASKARRVERLPFAAYYWAAPPAALRDLWSKLLLAGFLGFALRSAVGWRPGAVGAAGVVAGAALEAAQLAVVGRLPGVGDVIVFGAGTWAGGAAHAWWYGPGGPRPAAGGGPPSGGGPP